jgi:hypothetical protein
MLAPVEAEPAHVLLDRLDVLPLFLDRIGVVEAQVAVAAELLCHPEIEADRLGMADVEIAVRLGREARDHSIVPAGRQIGADDVAYEIPRAFFDCNLAHALTPGHCLDYAGIPAAPLSATDGPTRQGEPPEAGERAAILSAGGPTVPLAVPSTRS